MYQRAMCARVVRVVSGERQQPAHYGAEQRIDPEEEERQDHHHDRHEDRGANRFLAARPNDLAPFGTNLVYELAGSGLGHDDEAFAPIGFATLAPGWGQRRPGSSPGGR